jgi:hypothetical protein
MCRFYGWTLGQVLELSIDDFDQLWLSITTIEAREMLNRVTIADFPNMKQSARERVFKDLSDDAFPSSMRPVKQVSTSDLAKLLGG